MEPVVVELVVGGQTFAAFTDATVSYGAKDATRKFAVTVTDSSDPIQEQWNWMPGTECQVKANGDLLVTGIISTMTPSYDEAHHHVGVSGESKAKDADESSAEHQTSEFRNKDPLEIAKAIDGTGTNWTSDIQLDKVDLFRLDRNENVVEAVERVARKQQAQLMGTADGGIKITKGGTKRVHPPLIEGQNIRGASAIFSENGQHDEIKVKGQKVYGTDTKALQIVQKIDNKNVTRHRPKHIHSESEVDEGTAKKRGEKQRDRQQGRSVTCSIRVQGWHDDNGVPWEPNTVVFINSPKLKLYQDMLLDTVSCTQGKAGSFTQLGFVQPSTAGSTASTGSKTDPVWQNKN